MIVYDFIEEKSGDIVILSLPAFEGLRGYGQTRREANNDLWKNFLDDLQNRIKTGQRFPASVPYETIKKRRNIRGDEGNEGNNIYAIKLNFALKMYLHTVMLDKNITRPVLASLLALTEDEMPEGDWGLEKIRHLKPQKKLPQYKKVQRLLDLHHQSTIEEMQEAFWRVGQNLDVVIRPYGIVQWEPVVEI